MSAWAHLYSLASSWIKRPAVWLGGFLVAAAGTYVTTNLMTPVQTFLAEKTAEKKCQYQQTPISDKSQFIVLVSPLKDDLDGSQTKYVKSAFHGEKGFLVVPICESLAFDYSKDLQTAEDDTLQRAKDLIKARHADLLLFGEVGERDKAVKIWAVNEHGGCNLHPRPTIIEHGDLPGDFTDEQKKNLIIVSLKEIQSACLNQASIDWLDFAKRMKKMEMFLKYLDFSQARSLRFASSYIEAMRLLYYNGQGDDWFSKGEKLAKSIIDRAQGSSEKLNKVYVEYANLLDTRFDKSKDKNDQDAALLAFDKAIGLDPNDAYAYANRGNAYGKKGEWDRAIEDYTKAIGLDRKYALAYYNRGVTYGKKGDPDRAIEDYTKAIGLDPKNAPAYHNRGYAFSEKSDWDRAIEDLTKAIALDPNDAAAYGERGEAYGKKDDFDHAIEDYTKAIGLDPIDTSFYGNRGDAYLDKGDWDRAIEDYTKAIGLDPKNAPAYHNRGYAFSEKSDWDRAIEDYTKAIGLGPKDAFAYDARGDAYKKKGDLDRAIEDYTKAIGLYPKDKYRSVTYGSRAAAYLAKGDKKRSFADFKKGMELGGAPQ
jgi:tetratricopeptide (TPR) repeat protein